MRNLSLRQIEALQAIARAGSLIAAARELNMTASALAARLKNLEEAVGTPLFDRAASGLAPNAAGEAALAAAAKISQAVREFGERMEDVRLGRGGRLAVAAVSTAKYFAPRLIAAFMQSHPQLDLRFLIGNRAEVLGLLKANEVDVALMGRPPEDLPVVKTSMGPHPYVVAAAPTHRLTGARDVPREALAGESFLFREEGSGSRALFEYFIGDVPIRRPQLGIELGSNETIKQAVMAGLGIALISAHTIAAEVADGRLAVLDIAGLPLERRWYAVHRTDRTSSPAAQALRAFLDAQGARFLPELPRAALSPASRSLRRSPRGRRPT